MASVMETTVPSQAHASAITERFDDSKDAHKTPVVQDATETASSEEESAVPVRSAKERWFAYMRTPGFWLVVLLGQILSLCITSTNTFTSLLYVENAGMPALQTLFNYVLLNLIYTPYTIYRYGLKGYGQLLWKSGWKYVLLSILDVFGNYTAVLAYSYTTLLSAQLINFWAIVMVVGISAIFLHVRYRVTQIIGIFVCIGGMGILFASDRITGANQYAAKNAVKGDLFMLLSATLYGLDNVAQEFLVSKAPLYEVIGQLGFWGCIFNGILAGTVGRNDIRNAQWSGKVGGYLTGYTLCLSLFYTGAPLMFRMASAAFFNISLLTSNFWGVIIGVRVLHLHIHWMYPIAFVLIMVGLFIYFVREKEGGEAYKPWLGENQAAGVDGIGTARRKVVRSGVAEEAEVHHV